MILSPIRKVLSSIAAHGVRALLMGGQACILYGGAEFSRDIDFAILASEENLSQLKACLDELEAEVIAVPHSRWITSNADTPFISDARPPKPQA